MLWTHFTDRTPWTGGPCHVCACHPLVHRQPASSFWMLRVMLCECGCANVAFRLDFRFFGVQVSGPQIRTVGLYRKGFVS